MCSSDLVGDGGAATGFTVSGSGLADGASVEGERLGGRRFARVGVRDDSERAAAGRLVSDVLIGILARSHRNILSSFARLRCVRSVTVAGGRFQHLCVQARRRWALRPASCRNLPICWGAMSEEFVEYAGRSEPKERWLKALPLIIAGVLGVPLLCAAIWFSWQIAQTTKYLFDLDTSGSEAADRKSVV